MKNNFTLLIALLFAIFTCETMSAQAEPLNLTLTTISPLVIEGQENVDVKVFASNFNNIVGSQYILSWNPSVLEIVSIPFISSEVIGLSQASFALPASTIDNKKGRLIHSWTDPSTFGLTLPDNTLLYTMRFKVVGNECNSTSFSLLETAAFATEVLISNFEDVGATQNNLTFLITGNTCQDFNSNLACNDNVFVSVPSDNSLVQITPDMVLEGGPYNYAIMEVDLATVSCANNGEELNYAVTNTENNLTCWGTISVFGACQEFNSTLACNSLVYVSLPPWGGPAIITPDMLLEGGPYDYSVMSVSPSSVECSDIGTPVVVTVTNSDNGNTCWGMVNVEDKTPPVAIAKTNIVLALSMPSGGGDYSAKLFAESVDNGSYDNCSEIVFSPAFWLFDCSDLGIQSVQLQVTDAVGNMNVVSTDVSIILKDITELNCPDNIVVDCSQELIAADGTVDITGVATLTDGCVIPFVDTKGYDANGDGDLDDTYELNGVTVSESFTQCNQGSLLRTWFVEGSSVTCEQIIAIEPSGNIFDGMTMVDWPYSKNAFINIASNDSGSSCGATCGLIKDSDIELRMVNGVPVGASVTTNCLSALCEMPAVETNSCALVGFSTQADTFYYDFNELKIFITYTVIDWCSYDPTDPNTSGLWTWEVIATVTNTGSQVSVFADDEYGTNGQVVCVPIRVSNFTNIESFQGSLTWNSQVAKFKNIQNFGLNGLDAQGFGLDMTNNGVLSYLWLDNTGNSPASKVDGSIIFEVCYDVIGTIGSRTEIAFADAPTPMEVSSNFTSLGLLTSNGSITVGIQDCSNDNIKPTPYCISLSTAVVNANRSVDLWAIDFNAGSFDNCSASNKLRYTFSDTPPSLDPAFVTGSNSSVRTFSLNDYTTGSNFTLTTSVYVWDESNNNDYCQVSLTLHDTNGNNNNAVTLTLEDRSGALGSNVCVPLKVKNFTDIETVQGSIDWDPSVAKFTHTRGYNLPGFSAGLTNTGNAASGILSFLWFDSTGSNTVNLIDGTSVFEICFDLVGIPGSSTSVALTDNPSVVQVSSPGGVRSVIREKGTLRILSSSCSLEAEDIVWPTSVLVVNVPGSNSSNASTTMSPDALLMLPGLTNTDVYPTYSIPAECLSLVANTYHDEVFEIANDQVKILRSWTILDWSNGNVYTFEQVIRNHPEGNLICDFLPNSAPVGDCNSGHSLEDDVEWPDDLSIEDHRITPDELVASSGVDMADSRPIFYNFSDLYVATYIDIVGGLSPTSLMIDRVWTVTRIDFFNQVWTYTQVIDIDLSDFGNLVTVNTMSARPVPNVDLNDMQATNNEGLAYVEGEVNPNKADTYKNGLNIRDMMLIQSYLDNGRTFNQYEKMAGDLNGDNNISGIDVFELERILLGLTSQTETEWMFEDMTSEIEFGTPKGHYIAIKTGDVDDSADLGFGSPDRPSENLIIEDRLLNKGESYFVPLYIGSDVEALGTELNLTFDNEAVEITGVNSDQVFGSISFNIINDNRIAMITENFDLSVESIRKDTPLLVIELTALENGVLKNVFGVSDLDESFILDANFELIQINEVIDGEITLGSEELDNTLEIDIYPNPSSGIVTIEDYGVFAGDDVRFDLFDVTGKLLLSTVNKKQVDLTPFVSGMYMYKISVDNRFVAGRLIKE